MMPSRPTYFAHVEVTVASIETRWRQDSGSTSSRYASGCRSNRPKHGMLTTRVAGAELLGRRHRVLELAAGGQEDEVERRGLLLGDVAALEARLRAGSSTGIDSSSGTAWRVSASSVGPSVPVERGDERARGLLGIGRADDVEVRDDPETRDGLDRLVGRAVLADADAVVRENVDDGQVAERREPDRRRGSSRRRRGTSRRSGGRCRAPRCR